MDREALSQWVDRFDRAWKTNDPEDIRALFPETPFEWGGPFGEVWREREAVVAHWLDTVDDYHDLDTSYEILGFSNDFGICRYRASFTRPPKIGRIEEDMILLVRLDGDGRVVEFREWFARPAGSPQA